MTFGKTTLKDETLEWLLSSNQWTKHKAQSDLLDKAITNNINYTDTNILKLIKSTKEWFPYLPKRHDDSKLSHYKLRMLTDFGLTTENNDIVEIIKKLKQNRNNDLFQIRQEIPEKDKPKESNGEQVWNALPCDSPLLTYILLKLDITDKEALASVDFFKKSWETDKGWFCSLPFVKGQYKREQIGCPIYGLMCLEVFSLFPQLHNSIYVQNAYKPLQYHKNLGKSLYYFGRSKKFWTLKYPYVWYNALYIGDVLSRFDCFKDSDVLKEIISWIENSFDSNGKITSTSMFREYKDWDFSNKKSPSPWLTLQCYKILKNYYS